MEASSYGDWESVKKALSGSATEDGPWYDLAGLTAAGHRIDKLVGEIGNGQIDNYKALTDSLKEIYDRYDEDSWNWCLSVIRKWHGESELSKDLLIKIIGEWKVNSIKLNNMILKDAMKEFDQGSMTGFGIDGDEEVKIRDFEAVRGSYDDNGFVKQLQGESEEITTKAEAIMANL